MDNKDLQPNDNQQPDLHKADVLRLREMLLLLLNREQKARERSGRKMLQKAYHGENARALERVLKLIDEQPPVA